MSRDILCAWHVNKVCIVSPKRIFTYTRTWPVAGARKKGRLVLPFIPLFFSSSPIHLVLRSFVVFSVTFGPRLRGSQRTRPYSTEVLALCTDKLESSAVYDRFIRPPLVSRFNAVEWQRVSFGDSYGPWKVALRVVQLVVLNNCIRFDRLI